MEWDGTMRLMLPLVVLLLAAVIAEILHGPRTAISGMQRAAIALLAVTMLGLAGWWIASLLPSGDVPEQATHMQSSGRGGD